MLNGRNGLGGSVRRGSMKLALLAVCTMGSIAHADEKNGHVVSVGTCYSAPSAVSPGGFVVIATMDNGDHLALGDLGSGLATANLQLALSAQASQQSVYYQISSTPTICGQARGGVSSFVLNGSIN